MSAPAPFRGPTGGDPNKVRDAIVKDAGEAAAKQIKTHVTTALTATEKRLIEAVTASQARDAFDKGKAAGMEIGAAQAKAGRTWHYLAVALFAAAASVLATMYVYERTTLFGVAIGRGEMQQDRLSEDLADRMGEPK